MTRADCRSRAAARIRGGYRRTNSLSLPAPSVGRAQVRRSFSSGRGQLYRQPVELLCNDDLATEPRGLGQIEGEIQHIILVFARFLQQVVPIRLDDDMTCRAGERAFAGAFDVDVVATSYLEYCRAERRVDLPRGSVALDKDYLRHQPGPGAASTSGRGAKSSASIAAARTGIGPAANSALPARRNTSSPACSAASRIHLAVRRSGFAASAITACVTGRASTRSARMRAPSSSSCQAGVSASFPGTRSV